MLKHALIASLMLVACDKSNSVGEVADSAADDDDDNADDDDDDDSDDDDDDDAADDDDDDDDDDAQTCGAGEMYVEPAGCLLDSFPQLPSAGCYEPCGGEDTCGAGTTCQTVQHNPCPCPPDAEACCGACGGEVSLCMPDSFDAVCASIIGRHFESLEQLECGQTPDGVALCNWSIDFAEDGTFAWNYSDIGQSGTYTCEGGILEARIGADAVENSFDLESATLTWDGVEYEGVTT